MNIDQFRLYFHACGAVTVAQSRIDMVFKVFNTNSNNELTLRGFLEFYSDACMNRLDSVWRDLVKMGYEINLRKVRTHTLNVFMPGIFLVTSLPVAGPILGALSSVRLDSCAQLSAHVCLPPLLLSSVHDSVSVESPARKPPMTALRRAPVMQARAGWLAGAWLIDRPFPCS